MDELTTKLSPIESSLHDSRRKLGHCEDAAGVLIGAKMSSMRDALLQGDCRIEHVTEEIVSFLTVVDRHEPHGVDLKPQINWLSVNIKMIIRDLQIAETENSGAMQQTMTFQNLVNDISQKVSEHQHELDEASAEGRKLATVAETELRLSKQLADDAELNAWRKTREIESKTSEVANLQSQLSSSQSTLSEKESDLYYARIRAEKKKDKAKIAGGLAAVGFLAAPFTFGASLALTAGAGAVGIGMAIDYDNIKDQIASINSSIYSLQSQIRDAQTSVRRLIQEKSDLESRVSDLRSKIRIQEYAQQQHQTKISRVSAVESNITVLQSHAASTKSTTRDVKGELQRVKQSLDSFAVVLNEETTRLTVTQSGTDKSVSRHWRNAIAFEKGKAAMLNAAASLAEVHMKVPALLPAADTKFLKMKPEQNVVVSVQSVMPPLVLRTD